MKVKEFKKWLEDKNDNDIVIFSEYSYSSEAYTKQVDVYPRIKSPERTNFKHSDCKFSEIFKIKGQNRIYCNKIEDFINKYNNRSCKNFEHKDENIKFCLECRNCYAGYPKGCKNIYDR